MVAATVIIALEISAAGAGAKLDEFSHDAKTACCAACTVLASPLRAAVVAVVDSTVEAAA